MNKNEYNGWTNYETWVVNLWMDNEEGSQRYWHSVAREMYDDATDTQSKTSPRTAQERATYDLSEALKERHEDALPAVEGFAADLLGAAMSEVNWHEIASHLIDAVVEEVEKTTECCKFCREPISLHDSGVTYKNGECAHEGCTTRSNSGRKMPPK